jgi:hypothetical protein
MGSSYARVHLSLNMTLLATGNAPMNVSLGSGHRDPCQGTEHRFGDRAPLLAYQKAENLSAYGDQEGETVWLRVAAVAKTLLNKKRSAAADLCA